MAKTDFKSVDEYQATFPPEIKERLQSVRDVIKKAVPDAEEIISYQIPAYKYHGYLVYYSGYTSHISLSYPFSEALLETFRDELAGYKKSKSAIQFPHKEKLPLALIKKIVQFRAKENKETEALKAAKTAKKK